MTILSTTIFFLLAFYFLYIGLRVLLTKKPLIYAARNAFWLIALAFLPSMIFPIESFLRHYSFRSEHSLPYEWSDGIIILIPMLMYPLLLIFYWRILRGYSVVGVTDDSFRQALHHVLTDLKLPYEERLSRMHLTSINGDLEVNVNSWLGTASIRVKQREHQNTLSRIASGLGQYFAGSHVATNMVTSIYYVIFGVMMLASAVLFAYFFMAKNI